MEFFLPLYRTVRKWRNGVRAELELPLFPGYLFTRIIPAEHIRALQVPGVVGLVSRQGRPVEVPDEELEQLIAGLKVLKSEPHPFLAIGDRVRILRGPLQGLEGVLVRSKHDYRVVIAIDWLMRSISVEIDVCDLERISTVTQ